MAESSNPVGTITGYALHEEAFLFYCPDFQFCDMPLTTPTAKPRGLSMGQVTFTDEYDRRNQFSAWVPPPGSPGAPIKPFCRRFQPVQRPFPVNNRVLIFPTDVLPKADRSGELQHAHCRSELFDQLLCKVCARTTAKVVLGQPDFNNNLDCNLTQNGFRTFRPRWQPMAYGSR